MKKRILFGLLMILGVLAVFYLDYRFEQMTQPVPEQPARFGIVASRAINGLPLAVLVFALLLATVPELSRLAKGGGIELLSVSTLVGSLMLGTLPYWWQVSREVRPHGQDVFPVLGFILLLCFAEQMIRHRTEDAFRRIACTVLAIMYLGIGAACILAIRMDYDFGVLAAFLIAVKFTDIGAYFAGVLFGRHKLIAWLSPGKTWEGLIGGIIAAMAATIAWIHFYPPMVLIRGHMVELWHAAVFGLAMALAGQFADLCESLLKRAVSAKDSGQVVPGFGGLLDILDSPLLAAPVGLMILRAVFG